jgi:lactate dehydrogenase-like 2-hydroxyacid dehydrogenase
MPPLVLVTAEAYNKGQAVFRAASDVEFRGVAEKENLLAAEVLACGARVVVVGSQRYEGPLYEALAQSAAGQSALLARFGVGHDNVDKSQARRLGIYVTNTPGVLDDSVAEHTLWLLGSLVKQINRQELRLRQGLWHPSVGMELRNKTLAVVGFGAIGRRVASAAHFGFGMRVVAVGSRPADEFECRQGRRLDEILTATGAAEYTDNLAAALGQANIVSLHAPATAATRHLMDRDRLQQLKADSLLINTARGALVDEEALYDALIAGWLAAAALDVFEHEPYQPVVPEKDLRSLGNVLMTPHIGSNTIEANRRMAESVLMSILRFLDGKSADLPRVDKE